MLQSTGVYWIPQQDVLERAGLEVAVVDARGTKNLPGRKSDVQECQWIRKLDIYGLLRNCFQLPAAMRAIRTLWRLRRGRWMTDAGRTTCNTELPPSECNWLLQTKQYTPKPQKQLSLVKTSYQRVTGELPERGHRGTLR